MKNTKEITNDNNELLEYIYQTTDMGKKGLVHLLEALKEKDNKIKKDIEKSLEEYEEFQEECQDLLEKHNIEPKDKGLMTEMMNKMGVNINVMMDNSDSKVAEIIIQGLTMGVVEMEKKIKDYQDEVDKKISKLAKNILKFQEKEIEKYKEYL